MFTEQLMENETSILYGYNLTTTKVPVYAFVSTCNMLYRTFVVTYWFFYPFNEGKELCSVKLGYSKALPVFNIFKKCLGKTVKYGNHIGDWEHMSLEFRVSLNTFLMTYYVLFTYNLF